VLILRIFPDNTIMQSTDMEFYKLTHNAASPSLLDFSPRTIATEDADHNRKCFRFKHAYVISYSHASILY
jgi:hypothetical protein